MKQTLKTQLVLGLVLGSCLLCTEAVAERIYKWVDDQGNVHFGDKRPTDGASEEFTIKVPKGSPAAEKQQSDTNDKQDTKKDGTKSALNAEAKAEMKKYCDQARANLQTLETRSRIRITEGESIRYLTPDEIDAKKQEIQDALEKDCKGF